MSWRTSILGCVAALACSSTSYYDAYRASHPDWDGAFPREGASLDEVIAALHAPATSEDARIEVEALQLWRVDGDVASRLDFEALRRGETQLADDTDVAVLAPRACRAERGLKQLEVERVGVYLLPDLRLQAWDHYDFGHACAVENAFRAARPGAVALERAAAGRVAADYGRPKLELAQLYRRGIAYLEAGRVVEAQAALTAAEPLYRDASLRVQRGEAPPEAIAETARLRAQLMRALGVEAQTPAAR
jgi:hypothetical protein